MIDHQVISVNRLQQRCTRSVRVSLICILKDSPRKTESNHGLTKLFARLPKFTGDTNMTADLFTTVTGSDGTPALSTQRPALLVSATSWTADEDFSILLDALSQYNRAVDALSAGLVGRGAGTLPAVVVIITGKGAGKTEFEAEVAKLETKWKWVRVRTAWLPLEDYPRLLGESTRWGSHAALGNCEGC